MIEKIIKYIDWIKRNNDIKSKNKGETKLCKNDKGITFICKDRIKMGVNLYL